MIDDTEFPQLSIIIAALLFHCCFTKIKLWFYSCATIPQIPVRIRLQDNLHQNQSLLPTLYFSIQPPNFIGCLNLLLIYKILPWLVLQIQIFKKRGIVLSIQGTTSYQAKSSKPIFHDNML